MWIYSKPLYAYVIQLVIMSNYMNGKDTHIRGLKIVGPLECVYISFLSVAYSLQGTCTRWDRSLSVYQLRI